MYRPVRNVARDEYKWQNRLQIVHKTFSASSERVDELSTAPTGCTVSLWYLGAALCFMRFYIREQARVLSPSFCRPSVCPCISVCMCVVRIYICPLTHEVRLITSFPILRLQPLCVACRVLLAHRFSRARGDRLWGCSLPCLVSVVINYFADITSRHWRAALCGATAALLDRHRNQMSLSLSDLISSYHSSRVHYQGCLLLWLRYSHWLVSGRVSRGLTGAVATSYAAILQAVEPKVYVIRSTVDWLWYNK